jgi:hypothetical protein
MEQHWNIQIPRSSQSAVEQLPEFLFRSVAYRLMKQGLFITTLEYSNSTQQPVSC